ncbi:MAG TPA: VOC family protein, partial [Chryseolinea sp.]|nr:VOC family protein [Chryseolinea sp.]
MKTVFQSVIVVMIMISYQYGSAQSSANSEVPALSLNHIAMYVNDLKKSTSFYENILGLKQIPEPFHDGKHTWFTIGAAGSLHLIQGAPANISRDKN